MARIILMGLDSEDPRHTVAALTKVGDRVSDVSVQKEVLPRVADAAARMLEVPESPALLEVLERWGARRGSTGERPPARFVSRIVDDIGAYAKDKQVVPAVAPVFRRLLETPLRQQALEFFRNHWEELPDLLGLLRSGPEELRREALGVTLGILDEPLFARIATDRSMPFDVRAGVLGLVVIHWSERLAPVITSSLGDPDHGIVLVCLDRIRAEVGPRPMPYPGDYALGEQVRDGVRNLLPAKGDRARPPAVRSAALETLVALRDLEGCLDALADPLPRIRVRAAVLLRDYDDAYRRAAESGDLLIQRQLLGFLEEVAKAAAESEPRPKGRLVASVAPHISTAWVRRLNSLYGSSFEEVRWRVMELLDGNHGKVESDLGLSERALGDPSVRIRRLAASFLAGRSAFDPLLGVWDDLRTIDPELALDAAGFAARSKGRLDFLRALREHPDPEIHAEAARQLFDLAKPGQVRSFLSDPLPEIRAQAVQRLAEAYDLEALGQALADDKGVVALVALEALLGFSREARAVLESAGASKGDFETLAPGKRRAISESLLKWLKAKGKAVWIGRAKELVGGDHSHHVTLLLVAALPEPEAIEMLVACTDDIDIEVAADALARKGMKGPLRRMAERLEKDKEHEGFVPASVLKALARVGESQLAARYVAKGIWYYGDDELEEIIRASSESGPEGPLPFLELLAGYPDKDDEVRAMVLALRESRSAEGLRRALVELPAPPTDMILGALITVGDPEPVLREALEGEFWHEAACALHEATGEWYGFFGPDMPPDAWPEKRGFVPTARGGTVEAPSKAPLRRGKPGVGRGRAAYEHGEPYLDPEARRAAVDAWRKALREKARTGG